MPTWLGFWLGFLLRQVVIYDRLKWIYINTFCNSHVAPVENGLGETFQKAKNHKLLMSG